MGNWSYNPTYRSYNPIYNWKGAHLVPKKKKYNNTLNKQESHQGWIGDTPYMFHQLDPRKSWGNPMISNVFVHILGCWDIWSLTPMTNARTHPRCRVDKSPQLHLHLAQPNFSGGAKKPGKMGWESNLRKIYCEVETWIWKSKNPEMILLDTRKWMAGTLKIHLIEKENHLHQTTSILGFQPLIFRGVNLNVSGILGGFPYTKPSLWAGSTRQFDRYGFP